MSNDLLLAIDNGSQSVRAVLFDTTGELVEISQVQIEPYFSDQPGWAEQHADYFWDNACKACQALWEKCPEATSRVIGVAVTTQRGTVVLLDKDNQPVRPAISWLDQRQADVEGGMGPIWDTVFKAAGVTDTVNYGRAQAEANWVKQHEPELWAKTDKFMLLSGYLNFKLTDRFADSIGSQVAYQPFDFRTQDWAKDFMFHWKMYPIERDQVCELVPVGQQLGTVTKEAAVATGIPEGLPVIAGAADKACEVLGSGVLEKGTGCVSFGTTATIDVVSPKYVEPIPYIPPYPGAVPNTFNMEIQLFRGFWMVSWFKQNFGHREVSLAEEMGVVPEVLFDDLLNASPAGAHGLVVQPYWTPGIKQPGPEARGAMIGFGDIHSRADVYRAIIEGLGYGLREGKERIEKRTKTKVEQLIISGGGSQSDAAMQLTADLFGIEAHRPHVYETSALGAAMDVAVGLGVHPDFPTAVQKMTRIRDTFEPNMDAHQVYNELYQNVYLKMYDKLKPFYQTMRKLTAYPP